PSAVRTKGSPLAKNRCYSAAVGPLGTSGLCCIKDFTMRFLTLAVLFALPLPLPAAEPAKADPRPNILYCLADDWAYPHAGVYGDKVVETPVFDGVAKEAMLFHRAHCVSPSCTPSRAAMLTGQWIHRLEESGNLWSTLDKKFATYPDLLEKAGYVVGLWG